MNFKKLILLGSALAFAIGCGSEDDTGTDNGTDTGDGDGDDADLRTEAADLEIFSWWKEGAEIAALNALLKTHTDVYKKVNIINAAAVDYDAATEKLDDRLAAGDPPNTFQAGFGSRINKLVLFNETDASDSKLASLNSLGTQNDWFNTIPKVVLDSLSYDGTLYAVPVNVHRLNSVYYNAKVLKKEGLEIPESTSDLVDMLKTLKEKGYSRPACVGNQFDWPMDVVFFDAILPAVTGAEYHNKFWTGKADPSDAEFVKTLEFTNDIWQYFNEDKAEIDWVDGLDLLTLEDDPCAFTAMGDWALGHFEDLGLVGEEDFYQRGFPGESVYVANGDAFPLPKGVKELGQTKALLSTIGSVEGQTAFNVKKGSIPARQDVNEDDFSPTLQAQIKSFAADDTNIVMAHPVIVQQGLFDGANVQLKAFLAGGDAEDFVDYMANEYDKFR